MLKTWSDSRILKFTIFALLLILGAAISSSYSIPMDEPNLHQLALDTWEYVLTPTPWPESVAHRFHGPLVDISIYVVQKLFNLGSGSTLITSRHFLTFLWFIGGVAAFYVLVKKQTKNEWLALLGSAFLVLSPRIFGQAFINSRDVPFMSLFTLAMLALWVLLDTSNSLSARKHAWKWAAAFGLATAAATAVRTMGVFLPVLATVLFLIQLKHQSLKSTVKLLGVVYSTTAVFTILLWPLLWENTITNGLEALTFSGSFEGGSFFFGEILESTPWYYVPVWIVISTPFLYTTLALVGFGFTVKEWKSISWKKLFPVLWFGLPLLVLILTKAGLYNDWRHVFFLYPAVLLLTLTGFQKLWNYPYTKQVLGTLTAISMSLTMFWMVKDHPMQMLYFSIPSSLATDNFELDFWAFSSRAALQIIAEQDDAPIIGISATNSITYYNAYTFFPDRIFFEAKNNAQVDYIIDTSNDQEAKDLLPAEALIGEVKVSGNVVARVYKSTSYQVSSEDKWEQERAAIQARPKPDWTYGAWEL